MKTIAMIPCRLGSERIPFKNLRLMGDKLLCEHLMDIGSQVIDSYNIWLNSEHELFHDIATNMGCKFHKRPAELASASATTDEFVYEFMNSIDFNDDDILILLNPPCPLLTKKELEFGLLTFMRKGYNSMNTVVPHQIQTFFLNENVPEGLNCSFDGKLQKTQSLKPTYTLVFAFMGWRVGVFKKVFEERGYALFNEPCLFAEVSTLTAINKLSYEEDWEVVERILTGSYGPPRYHQAITKLIQ